MLVFYLLPAILAFDSSFHDLLARLLQAAAPNCPALDEYTCQNTDGCFFDEEGMCGGKMQCMTGPRCPGSRSEGDERQLAEERNLISVEALKRPATPVRNCERGEEPFTCIAPGLERRLGGSTRECEPGEEPRGPLCIRIYYERQLALKARGDPRMARLLRAVETGTTTQPDTTDTTTSSSTVCSGKSEFQCMKPDSGCFWDYDDLNNNGSDEECIRRPSCSGKSRPECKKTDYCGWDVTGGTKRGYGNIREECVFMYHASPCNEKFEYQCDKSDACFWAEGAFDKNGVWIAKEECIPRKDAEFQHGGLH